LQALGNDIVDLDAPGNPGRSRDSRFLERVFTAEERCLIERAGRPDALVWGLWAAKEAAYKAVSREDPAVCAIPRRYPVSLEGGDVPGAPVRLAGSVLTPRGSLALAVEVTDQWVHALAAPAHRLGSLCSGVERPGDADDPPEYGRRRLIEAVSRLAGCRTGELDIVRGGQGTSAPCLLFRGELLAAAISLSHDGRFTAFAFDLAALWPSFWALSAKS
jgi:hypothetical protein